MTDDSPPRRHAMPAPLVTATWRDMLIVTWVVDPAMVRPFVPAGTELDSYKRDALVSLVATHATDVRLHGRRIPLHESYLTLGLHTYVRPVHSLVDPDSAGTALISAMASHRGVAMAANLRLGERYDARAMRHVAVPELPPEVADARRSLVYEWKRDKEWERMAALTVGAPRPMRRDSVEAFVSNRHWGYVRRRQQPTLAYYIAHERWNISLLANCLIEVDLATMVGPHFTKALEGDPVSSFAADRASVALYQANALDAAHGAAEVAGH